MHILSDGCFHSGQTIATKLGVSRAAVWKSITRIRQDWQLDIQAVKGKGYRLNGGINLLDENRIKSFLSNTGQTKIINLEVLPSIESSNHYLMKKAGKNGVHSGYVVITEHQTAGRGRRGRIWLSPFGQNIYLSVLWEFVETNAALSGLSLVVAIAILRVLKRMGIRDAGLKWPNDIHWHGKKLCGILLEMKGEVSGACNVVIGIGLNVNMPDEDTQEISQPWTSLLHITGTPVDRNELTAEVIKELFIVLEHFQKTGLHEFRDEWNLNDLALNNKVNLHTAEETITGIAQGIDEQGALILKVNGVRQHYHAGEVSLRYNPPVC